jgi:hypothetical protein
MKQRFERLHARLRARAHASPPSAASSRRRRTSTRARGRQCSTTSCATGRSATASRSRSSTAQPTTTSTSTASRASTASTHSSSRVASSWEWARPPTRQTQRPCTPLGTRKNDSPLRGRTAAEREHLAGKPAPDTFLAAARMLDAEPPEAPSSRTRRPASRPGARATRMGRRRRPQRASGGASTARRRRVRFVRCRCGLWSRGYRMRLRRMRVKRVASSGGARIVVWQLRGTCAKRPSGARLSAARFTASVSQIYAVSRRP